MSSFFTRDGKDLLSVVASIWLSSPSNYVGNDALSNVRIFTGRVVVWLRYILKRSYTDYSHQIPLILDAYLFDMNDVAKRIKVFEFIFETVEYEQQRRELFMQSESMYEIQKDILRRVMTYNPAKYSFVEPFIAKFEISEFLHFKNICLTIAYHFKMYRSRHVFIENFNTFVENHRGIHRKNPEFQAVVLRSFSIIVSNITQINRRELAQIKAISKRNGINYNVLLHYYMFGFLVSPDNKPTALFSNSRFKTYMYNTVVTHNAEENQFSKKILYRKQRSRRTVFNAMSQDYRDKISRMIKRKFDRNWIRNGFNYADYYIINQLVEVACDKGTHYRNKCF